MKKTAIVLLFLGATTFAFDKVNVKVVEFGEKATAKEFQLDNLTLDVTALRTGVGMATEIGFIKWDDIAALEFFKRTGPLSGVVLKTTAGEEVPFLLADDREFLKTSTKNISSHGSVLFEENLEQKKKSAFQLQKLTLAGPALKKATELGIWNQMGLRLWKDLERHKGKRFTYLVTQKPGSATVKKQIIVNAWTHELVTLQVCEKPDENPDRCDLLELPRGDSWQNFYSVFLQTAFKAREAKSATDISSFTGWKMRNLSWDKGKQTVFSSQALDIDYDLLFGFAGFDAKSVRVIAVPAFATKLMLDASEDTPVKKEKKLSRNDAKKALQPLTDKLLEFAKNPGNPDTNPALIDAMKLLEDSTDWRAMAKRLDRSNDGKKELSDAELAEYKKGELASLKAGLLYFGSLGETTLAEVLGKLFDGLRSVKRMDGTLSSTLDLAKYLPAEEPAQSNAESGVQGARGKRTRAVSLTVQKQGDTVKIAGFVYTDSAELVSHSSKK